MPTPSDSFRGLAAPVGDSALRVEAITDGLVRVRQYHGAVPPTSWLIRYGFIRDDLPVPPGEAGLNAVAAGPLTAALAETSRLSFIGPDGVVLREAEPALTGPLPHASASFHLPADVALFGLGDSARDRLEQRGVRRTLWCANVTSYVPVPLIWSTAGYAILVNSTRAVTFDLGATTPDRLTFEIPGGALDYYVIYGPDSAAIFERYTRLTGRPPLPPKWAMGLFFISRTQADAKEFLDDCLNFRRSDIPCDAISLEPGWMSRNYDFSVTKDWHPDRFPVPSYARKGRHNFFNAARRMGFKPGLWLCCDYDLSWEAERQAAAAAHAAPDEEAPTSAGFEQDAHLFRSKRMDQLTRPEEPWFQHLQDFVDQGAEHFKQDGANQVLSHPDRLYANGMHDDEMHNLNPLLYSRQMYEGFVAHTGRRPFVFTVAGWVGLQRWCNTWTGDTGGEQGPLGACLNLSLTAHGMTTPDMEVTTAAGIHFGFLLPWSQLNSWNYWRHPWLLGEPLESIFRDYAKLRYSLIPYLYACAAESWRTGYPMLRAMPLEDPANPATHELLHQYLLGPSLLVGAFTDRVWLPAGEWFNHWTGERHTGPGWCTPAQPADRGGPLLVRAGTVLPTAPPVNYVGERPDDELIVHVWPGPASEVVLYEDDGLSLAYEQGACRTQRLAQEPLAGGLRLTLAAAEGTFDGALPVRRVTVVAHLPAGPVHRDLGEVAVDQALTVDLCG